MILSETDLAELFPIATAAWDCDLFHQLPDKTDSIDEESDDWQGIVLDRFGDRLVNGGY